MKTLKGWEKSNLDLDEYLTEPCEINEELALYIAEIVPVQYSNYENRLIQGGDAIKSEPSEGYNADDIYYYMTTYSNGKKHFYLGILPEFRE